LQKTENSIPVPSSSKPNQRPFDVFVMQNPEMSLRDNHKHEKARNELKDERGYNINEKGRIYYKVAKVANWKGRQPI